MGLLWAKVVEIIKLDLNKKILDLMKNIVTRIIGDQALLHIL